MNNLYRLLNLNKLEQKVLGSVTGKERIVVEIARDAKIPRTSVDAVVERLLRRGLLKKTKRQKRFYYTAQDQSMLVREIFPQEVLPAGRYALPLLGGAGIIIHSGLKKLLDLYETLYTKHAHKRIYGIQPTASAQIIMKKVSQNKINHFNTLISESGVVQESIIESDYFEKIKACNPKYAKWLQQFQKRISATYVIDKEAISFENELIIYGQVVALVDWKNLVAIEILHPQIVKMFKDLYKGLQKSGKKIQFLPM